MPTSLHPASQDCHLDTLCAAAVLNLFPVNRSERGLMSLNRGSVSTEAVGTLIAHTKINELVIYECTMRQTEVFSQLVKSGQVKLEVIGVGVV